MVNTVTETQVGGMHFEDGSMGHEPSNAGTTQEPEKNKKWIPGTFRQHIALQTP